MYQNVYIFLFSFMKNAKQCLEGNKYSNLASECVQLISQKYKKYWYIQLKKKLVSLTSTPKISVNVTILLYS
jgi:hypothetical protein